MLDQARSWVRSTNEDTEDDEDGVDAGIDFFSACSRQPDVALAWLVTVIHVADGDEKVLDQIICGPIYTFLSQCPENFKPTLKTVVRQQPTLARCVDLERLN